MLSLIALAHRSLLRDAAVLATGHLGASAAPWPAWGEAEADAVRAVASRLLVRQAECARVVGADAARLVQGIGLVPYLGPAGGFGPAWPAHPLASPGWHDARPLREPDATRALAAFMGPAAGPRGAERARSFLQILAELAGVDTMGEALAGARRPVVTAEHPVKRAGRALRAPPAASGRAAPRIDLLFEWPLGEGARRAVVVVEAKLGAAVASQQLRPYREEARRRAGGGPVALVLLTARADPAEARHRAWRPVRWFALLRRWEVALAAAGDIDPEFARLRASLWRYVLKTEKACR